MKVFRIGTGELELIEEGLELLEQRKHNSYATAKCMGLSVEEVEHDIAHIKTTRKLLQDQRLQELCERCLSYFWDMYKEMGGFCDLLEELINDMGIDEEELVELFKEAGYEE